MAPTGDEPESETYSVISSNGPPYIQDRRLYFPLDEENCVFPFRCYKNSSIDMLCTSTISACQHLVLSPRPILKLKRPRTPRGSIFTTLPVGV